MKQITDQLVLLIYCFITILITGEDTEFLVAFLVAVIYSCINALERGRLSHLISSAVYLLLAVLFPDLFLFCPVILYSMLRCKNYIMTALLAVLFLWNLSTWNLSANSLLLALFMAAGCLIAGILYYRTSSYETLDDLYHRTQDDNTERNLLLKEKNHALLENQDYEIYTATLKERNRIAREIHDNVGHMLSRSILMTGAIKMTCKDPAVNEQLLLLEETLNAAMSNVRESVHDLHDESVNLKEVLYSLTDTFTFCPVTLEYDMGYDVPREIKYCFITIVKEALNNIMRHSHADRAHILVREHPGLYQLEVEDNGANVHYREDSGIGISNMKDRVKLLRGTMQIHTDKGFRIFITIPKKEDV